jgi:hypothetical protein
MLDLASHKTIWISLKRAQTGADRRVCRSRLVGRGKVRWDSDPARLLFLHKR